MPRISGLNYSDVPVGSIQPYGGTTAPDGWLLCDGISYLRTDYPLLYAVITTAFGAADGTHFNVPDLRGRFIRGLDGTAGVDPDKTDRSSMATGGNSGNNVGSIQGHEHLAHNHEFPVTDPISGAVFKFNPARSPPDGGAINNANFTFTGLTNYGNAAGLTENIVSTAAANLWNVGGKETRPVNAYANFIIKYR